MRQIIQILELFYFCKSQLDNASSVLPNLKTDPKKEKTATKFKVSENNHYKGLGFLKSPPPSLRNNTPKY